MRGVLALIAFLLLLLALAPAAALAQAGADTVVLAWTAPGDDGNVGTASGYELRMAPFAIDDANWNSATPIAGVPSPMPNGTRQQFIVRGLTRGQTYWFAIKSVDDNSNWSGLSNVLRWDWVFDTTAPLAPLGVNARREGSDRDVRVTWNASPEPDLSGYSVYRRDVQGGPFQRISGAILTSTQILDQSVPAGSDAVWYQVTATDQSGNESARSAVAGVSFTATIAGWEMDAVYPNPSNVNGAVNLPIMVPTSSSGRATIEIVNAGRQTVRRLDVSGLTPGPRTVQWDGLSESGRPASPGVYTAWLIAGGERRSVKLVRVP
jgi:hypothetical protein